MQIILLISSSPDPMIIASCSGSIGIEASMVLGAVILLGVGILGSRSLSAVGVGRFSMNRTQQGQKIGQHKKTAYRIWA